MTLFGELTGRTEWKDLFSFCFGFLFFSFFQAGRGVGALPEIVGPTAAENGLDATLRRQSGTGRRSDDGTLALARSSGGRPGERSPHLLRPGLPQQLPVSCYFRGEARG